MARLIKRYENRKLYDTTASAYVSRTHLATLIREGETIEVIDNATGDDLTGQILTQIIVDEGKRGKRTIPTDVLHEVIRRSNAIIDSSIEQVKTSVDVWMHRSIEQASRLLPGGGANELSALRNQLGQLETLLARVLEDKETKEKTDA
jgi:polyhydroxyalkanoate synthesis repressor PhaR